MEHQVRSRQNEFEDLRETYESSKADYAEMGDLLGATNERLQKSYAEVQSLQERQAELTELRSSLEEEATALRVQLDRQLEALEKAQDEAEALKASLAESQIEISALQSTQSAGTELEQHIQYVHAEYEETLAAKNAEIEQHRTAFEKAQSEAADFARTLADSTAELEELHRSIDENGGNTDAPKSDINAQISELRAELAATTDEKFELLQRLDELQNRRERGSATPNSPLDAETKLQSLRADYDARVLEFETRHRELVRQQEEAIETHRSEVDTLTADHHTELRKRNDAIESLREELDSLKEQLQNLRGVVTAVHSPAINIETSDQESVEERGPRAEATPGALEEGTRFDEFVTPMETQDEQEPRFEDADTTQTSASADSDGISDDGSYDMDFTHLDSQIGDNNNEPLKSPNTPSTIERKLHVKVPARPSANDTSTPPDQNPPSASSTTYSNSALTSQLAHLEAALELSRKETFHARSALESQISSLTSELEVTKAEKTSLQQKLANFNAAMDARDEAVFELGGVLEDDDVFFTGGAVDGGDGKGKKRKTIEGTLAGLRLQAKQLEELNEEFLSQSLRWSGILPLK